MSESELKRGARLFSAGDEDVHFWVNVLGGRAQKGVWLTRLDRRTRAKEKTRITREQLDELKRMLIGAIDALFEERASRSPGARKY